MTVNEDKKEGSLAQRLKPSGTARTALLLAALLWTGVGGFLFLRGFLIAREGGLYFPIIIGSALALGIFKGLKVMRPVASKGSDRIDCRGDGKCLGGFISWKSWLLVVGMGLMGVVIRRLGLPFYVVGPVLIGVGIALLLGAEVYWKAFFKKD